MYYMLINGAQVGPFDLQQFEAMNRDVPLPPGTLYWTEGMPEWRQVSERQGIAPATSAAPPPLPSPVPMHAPVKPQPHPVAAPVGERDGIERMINGLLLTPSEGTRRFLSYVIDYGLIIALSMYLPEWLAHGAKGSDNDSLSLGILVASAILRDVPAGGRSIGRLLTKSYVIDLAKDQPVTILKGMGRNAIQLGMILIPFAIFAALLGLFSSGSSTGSHRSGGIGTGLVVYLISLARSIGNPSGQGVWDTPMKTCVMVRAT